MAKILYSVCGEGSGHSSRAKEIINHLQKRGHHIKILSYDIGFRNLSEYFAVEKIFGLHLVYKNNQIKYFKTIINSFIKLPQILQSARSVKKIVKNFKPDLLITDFEPTSCFVARKKGLPIISIDNQHAITNFNIEYPKKYWWPAFADKIVINFFTYGADSYLVTSFFKVRAKRKKSFIFQPILKKEILSLKAKEGDYILVYFTSPFEGMIDILKSVNKKFIIYGLGERRPEKNLIFKKHSQQEFIKDLANTQAIIANSGYALISEALYLGKPYLAWPVKKQFEQITNAYYLEKMGYGKYWDKLNKARIQLFIKNLDKYKKNLRGYRYQDNKEIFSKIDEVIADYN
jgi:uncharacterized protein (TIGR00661 family)